jgi:2,4-dienoyl-CoA reductase-like NADH-dependent reductase (Old Yellow Enzyme family)
MIAGHKRLTESIREGGCTVFAQLNHAGSNGVGEPVSASGVNIPTKKLQKRPRALTVDEIVSIEDAFAAAAERAVKAGYDGVELHCAHAYLLNQFYSPLTNKRKDAYGGTLENRLRFLIETVARVRRAIGPDVPLAVRRGGAD